MAEGGGTSCPSQGWSSTMLEDTFCQGHRWYFGTRWGVLSSEPCRLRAQAIAVYSLRPASFCRLGCATAGLVLFFSPQCFACEKDLFYI